MSDINEAFGDGFAEKVKEARKASRMKPLDLSKEKNQIIKHVINNMNPEEAATIYLKDDYEYDVLLVKTPREIRAQPLKWGISFGVMWKNQWLNPIANEEQIEALSTDTDYLFVGKVKIKQGQNRKFYNLSPFYGAISMSEVAKVRKELEKDAPVEKEAEVKEYE